ncbi:MAG TPA: hypothetical protein DCS13_13125 [Candidatus Margulisbacteria bacterium]|nr:MAG: hypothetical protein A2X43_10705 [Candidatus Margulisbacteria bacterium GWD2_39_127]HAR64400.1 hypothetical protein [Candidatus Margulisiibacteriota bacterium]
MMIEKSTWKKSVRDWISINPKSHRFGSPMLDTFPHGVPIGGFGAGTIGISPSGSWNCWHLDPGKHCFEQDFSMGFQFSYESEGNTATLDYLDSEYSALYPCAQWNFLVGMSTSMKLFQYTPIIMDEYRYTSYPVGIFIVELNNDEDHNLTYEIKFTLTDILDRKYNRVVEDDKLHYEFIPSLIPAIIKRSEHLVSLSKVCSNNVKEEFGIYSSEVISKCVDDIDNVVVSWKITLKPLEKKTIDFYAVWDIPEICFDGDKRFFRKYTEYMCPDQSNLDTLIKELFEKKEWILYKIDEWQEKIWNNYLYEEDIKTLMINELYYLAHGGTLWEAKSNRFGYLECVDYPYYETLDVRYYSSWALLYGWPELEKQVMKQFADTIAIEDNSVIKFNSGYLAHRSLASAETVEKDNQYLGYRKRRGACPHDLGSFEENPFVKVNSYCFQNPNLWKDLNPKFILMIYRNYYYTKDIAFLHYCWPAVKEAFTYYKQFDRDDDGLPENDGWPDQTYDNWTMKGSSAYCAILWLSALVAYKEMSFQIGDYNREVDSILEKGLGSLNSKLWNKDFFNYDETLNDVMSDQLAGQWYLRFCNLPLVIPESNETRILDFVYQHNYLDFVSGKFGMVNGRTRAGDDVFTPQGNDVWTGVNYGISSYYYLLNKKVQGQSILDSLQKTIYEGGFAFRTPESFDGKGNYIAQMYMRPQAIWVLAFVG